MKGRTVFIAVLAIIILMLIAFFSDRSMISPYISVSELSGNLGSYEGQNVRVMARIKTGSLAEDLNSTRTEFTVSDGVSDIPVIYGKVGFGAIENETVVVIGKVSNGTIYGIKLQTKCPSKGKSYINTPYSIH